MPIHIMMAGDRYEAEVEASIHMPRSWRSEGPLTGADLIEKLLDLGYHQQDIVDAFVEADSDFVAKMNRGDFDPPVTG